MRFLVFFLAISILLTGCSRKDDQLMVLGSDEAKTASKLIMSLDASCKSRADVASFSGRLRMVVSKVTNDMERAGLANQYCRELLSLDLLGSPGNQDPMAIIGRCDIVKDFLYYSSDTLKDLGMRRFKVLEFAVAMCAHLREERQRMLKAVAKREGSTPKSVKDGWYIPLSKCPKKVDDVRQQWIWQYIDMPKEVFLHVFEDVSSAEKERLLKTIENEIGRRPRIF